MSDSREQILNRVRTALAPLAERAPLPEWDRDLVVLREALAATDLWSLFSTRMKAVNGTPISGIAELVQLLASNNWKHGYCDPALLPLCKDAFPADFTIECHCTSLHHHGTLEVVS